MEDLSESQQILLDELLSCAYRGWNPYKSLAAILSIVPSHDAFIPFVACAYKQELKRIETESWFDSTKQLNIKKLQDQIRKNFSSTYFYIFSLDPQNKKTVSKCLSNPTQSLEEFSINAIRIPFEDVPFKFAHAKVVDGPDVTLQSGLKQESFVLVTHDSNGNKRLFALEKINSGSSKTVYRIAGTGLVYKVIHHYENQEYDNEVVQIAMDQGLLAREYRNGRGGIICEEAKGLTNKEYENYKEEIKQLEKKIEELGLIATDLHVDNLGILNDRIIIIDSDYILPATTVVNNSDSSVKTEC